MTKQDFLEYIVGYLPYGLECEIINEKHQDKEIGKTIGIYDEGSMVFGNIVESDKGFHEVKPLLRPMSQLTEEITVGGETFIPMDKIRELFIEDKNKCCFIYRESFEDLYDWNLETTKQKCKMLPYEWVQLFYKWMLDINDLIGQGLATEKK